MTARSWVWDRIGSNNRGRLLAHERLFRLVLEIAGTALCGAAQMAMYAVIDRRRHHAR